MFIRVHFHCGAHSATATVAHVEWLYDLANTHTHTLSLPHTHACGPATASRQTRAGLGFYAVCAPSRAGFGFGLHLCGSNNVSFSCPSAG